MADYTATLSVLAKRAVEAVMDAVARDGLTALKSVLDKSGFAQSDELSGYTVAAHVRGDTVEFEILVPYDAVNQDEGVEEEMARAEDEKKQERKLAQAAARSFAIANGRVVKLGSHDARRPAVDARRGAKDKRKTAAGRMLEHEMALQTPRSLGSPRSMFVDRSGKLSLRFKRTVRETSNGVEYPKRGFDGVMKKVVDEIRDVVARSFVPELETIISRMVK